MAPQTPFFAKNWPVHSVGVSNHIHHRAVTPLTKFISFTLELQWIGRIRFIMTLIAHFAHDRLMHHVVDHARNIRAMGIMTTCASRLANRVSHMLFGKKWSVDLMASGTKDIWIRFQERLLLG